MTLPHRIVRLPNTDPPEAPTIKPGGMKLTDVPGLQAAADIEPLLRIAELARVLNCSRRAVERMRSEGRLPRPDLIIGHRSPRWRAETIRAWIDTQSR